MLEFPSILSSTGQSFRDFQAHVFGKLDGRNTRWEWTRKRGFHKFGTRDRRFDETDAEFGPAVKIFFDTLAKPLDRIFRKERLDVAVAFAEYYGDQSLGGVLVPGDAMRLSLIDASFDGRRLLDPRDYTKLFVGEVDAAPYVGRMHWTRGLIERVFRGELEGMSFEGVVGKGIDGELAKAKTKVWLDAVRSRYTPDVAERIVNS